MRREDASLEFHFSSLTMEISATSCTSSDLSPMQQAENDLGQIATGSTMFSPMNLFSRENSVTQLRRRSESLLSELQRGQFLPESVPGRVTQ